MQNFQILCRIWKHMNSAKHWIAIASKTVNLLQFYSRRKFSQISSVSFLVYQLLCLGSWSVKGRGPKTGECLGVLGECKIWLSAMQMPICQKRPYSRISYFRPYKYRPMHIATRAHASLRPLAAATVKNIHPNRIGYFKVIWQFWPVSLIKCTANGVKTACMNMFLNSKLVYNILNTERSKIKWNGVGIFNRHIFPEHPVALVTV